MKKFLRLIAIALMLTLIAGCAKKPAPAPENVEDTPAVEPDSHPPYKNPLTGVYEYEDEAMRDARPVAVAVNSQKDIRCHHTGLEDADIVFETYIEGLETRTLAIYKDITKVDEIGSLRSARVAFADIANSFDATYIHAGEDPTYCAPYMKSLGLDDVNLLRGKYYANTYRKDNGHILEHTLFSTGEKLNNMLNEHGIRRTIKDTHKGDWQNFNETAVSLTGGAATEIYIPFSGSYKNNFSFDTEKGAYVKTGHKDAAKHEDAYPDDEIVTENVVVLFTTHTNLELDQRVKVGMSGGEGYYFSNGTYQEIKWEKGDTYDSFKFTDADGNAISYNPGRTWVHMVKNDMKSKVTFN